MYPVFLLPLDVKKIQDKPIPCLGETSRTEGPDLSKISAHD